MLHIPAFQSVPTECDVTSLLSNACFLICFRLCLEFGLFQNVDNKNVHSGFNSVQIEVVIDFSFPLFLICKSLFAYECNHTNVTNAVNLHCLGSGKKPYCV